jgi:hypothetical protein
MALFLAADDSRLSTAQDVVGAAAGDEADQLPGAQNAQ